MSKEYKELIINQILRKNISNTIQSAIMEYIDTLSTEERKEIQQAILSIDSNHTMPCNLFYNYNTQEWI